MERPQEEDLGLYYEKGGQVGFEQLSVKINKMPWLWIQADELNQISDVNSPLISTTPCIVISTFRKADDTQRLIVKLLAQGHPAS